VGINVPSSKKSESLRQNQNYTIMNKYFALIAVLLGTSGAFAQKAVTLKETEEALQKNNLLVLAEQYNITASEAGVIQAKIWDQPFISGEINAYNPNNTKFFDAGKNGQKALAVQQLILLGGKRKNEVAFAKANVAIAQLQFEQLVRNLKLQLDQDFYNLYFDQRKIITLDLQISKLETLLSEYQVQAVKGNVPLKEVVRLQTLVLNLKDTKNNFQKNIIGYQQDMALITGITEPITPLVVDENETIGKFNFPKYSKDDMLNLSVEKNPDYLSVVKITESQDLYLKWQKSLSVPDITPGLAYDQRGGAFNNQLNLTLGIPLPLWNKNKGNIKAAEAKLSQSKPDSEYKKQEIQNNMAMAYRIWQQQQTQLASISPTTITNLETVYRGVLDNFQKRNISLLEFTDFMESYNQSRIQINEIKKQWIFSSLNLNYITNTEVF